MCTVTYLPKENTDYILTHNRDEHHTRSIALLPQIKILNNTNVLFPKDQQGGGTWIATSESFTLCLLNGGFVKHSHNPPYRHSRGLVILDFFAFKNVETFFDNYNLKEIEPFTLIIIDNTLRKLYQIVFDGNKTHLETKDESVAHIWSSVSLYSEEERNNREKYFERFKRNGIFTQEEIINFHTNQFEEYEHEGIQINRDDILKTVSLTSIIKSETITMFYKDFIQNLTLTHDLL